MKMKQLINRAKALHYNDAGHSQEGLLLFDSSDLLILLEDAYNNGAMHAVEEYRGDKPAIWYKNPTPKTFEGYCRTFNL